MEANIDSIFARTFQCNENSDLSELKQFQSMFIEYVHLMKRINIMAKQMSKKPDDLELPAQYN